MRAIVALARRACLNIVHNEKREGTKGMRWQVAGHVVALLTLTGCMVSVSDAVTTVLLSQAGPSPLRSYPDLSRFLHCVPFARTVAGIALWGDAWTWWAQAAGRYQRGTLPQKGAVLVFKQSPRLKRGHVAVVAQVSGTQELLLTHANWGNDSDTRGVVYERQPVRDVSARNDWSLVQLKNRMGKWGSVYATYGFIYQLKPQPVPPGAVTVS